jgi:hypothetical protein
MAFPASDQPEEHMQTLWAEAHGNMLALIAILGEQAAL